jgi:hypothetical protein
MKSDNQIGRPTNDNFLDPASGLDLADIHDEERVPFAMSGLIIAPPVQHRGRVADRAAGGRKRSCRQ